jgi:hypothetical protein
MAHNVPAVYDVFASPIKETVRFPGLAKMWVEGAVGRNKATDLGERNSGAAEGGGAHTVLLCAVILLLII